MRKSSSISSALPLYRFLVAGGLGLLSWRAEVANAQSATVETPGEAAPPAAPPMLLESAPNQADTDSSPRSEPTLGERPAAASSAPIAVSAEVLPTAAPTPGMSDVEGEKAAEPTLQIKGAPGQGFTVSTGDAFSLNIKSRILIRYQINTFDDANKDAQAIANIGTARVWLGGNVYKPELTYMIQLAVAGKDYRDNATSPIFDAYLEWKAHRDFSVRAGQYFVPFDRLRTVREWGLQMAERPRPVQEFTLDRDVGITFFSERFLSDSSPIAWYVSAFGGRGTNQVNPAAVGGLLVGRLELRPLGAIDDDREGDHDRREKPGLALGIGAARNFKSNRSRGTTGPTFVGGNTEDTQFAVDAVFKWMGFALQAEYLYKNTRDAAFVSERADGSTLTEYTREGRGWVTQASYTFEPPFEVVGRLTRLYYDDTEDPVFIAEVNKRGNEVAGGLNYYFNGHRMKAQATWIARTGSNLDLGKADHCAVAQLDATF